jgi:small GTP-binding protein
MNSCKVVITGTFNSGKTSFVQAASDIDIVTTERRISDAKDARIKEQTTVAMDYGQATVAGVLVHLYGTPGQDRFDFMWHILSRDVSAFVLLIDSQDRASFMDAVRMIRDLRQKTRAPYLVAANKQDGRRALSPDEIASALNLPDSVPVVSCVAKDPKSVRQVLEEAVALISA